jgi:adenylate cyclase
MGIFDPYKNVIKKAVERDLSSKKPSRGIGESFSSQNDSIKELRAELPGLEYFNKGIEETNGLEASTNVGGFPQLGLHPDFSYLRGTDGSEAHWIITGFIDVKGSTKLFNKFSKETARLITESIIRASIFAVNDCQGYVQRIQGDGLMVYFGGKGIDKKSAIEDALKSFAMIAHFVKNDLKQFFEENGINNIHTRAALDLGNDNQVIWHYSGVGIAGEVTTCSLHTSLVPKMQGNALDDGIMVGQNVVLLFGKDKYFDSLGSIWDYEDGRKYGQYVFNWPKYLVDIGKALVDREGQIRLVDGHTDRPIRNAENLRPIASQSKPYLLLE